MKTIVVDSKRDSKRFIQLPSLLYSKEKVWIKPIEKEVEKIFDVFSKDYPKQTLHKRWLIEQKGKLIGRIAAFAKKDGHNKIGGIGFFDCINSQEAANILFDVSKKWLIEMGMQSMDGPINLGNRDKWWGLLTKGYHIEPNYECNYNFPYYKELLENYGFQTYFEHYTFLKGIREPVHPRLQYKSDLVANNSDYSILHFDKKKFDQHTIDIIKVYNKAWVDHEGVSTMSIEQGKAIMNHLRPILDEKIVWLVYYKKEPVAFYINIPEVNQWFKHVNGKLDFLGKLKFLWYKNTRPNKKMMGKVFGIVPEHQGKGLDGALIMAFRNYAFQLGYQDIEISGIGDFNRKMILVIKQVGGNICKIHTTYRYQFDRSLPFERMKNIV